MRRTPGEPCLRRRIERTPPNYKPAEAQASEGRLGERSSLWRARLCPAAWSTRPLAARIKTASRMRPLNQDGPGPKDRPA